MRKVKLSISRGWNRSFLISFSLASLAPCAFAIRRSYARIRISHQLHAFSAKVFFCLWQNNVFWNKTSHQARHCKMTCKIILLLDHDKHLYHRNNLLMMTNDEFACYIALMRSINYRRWLFHKCDRNRTISCDDN